jgi:hypothetical protein
MAAVIPFSPGRVWIEFLISTYTCIGILSLMVLAVLGLFLWEQRLEMPRKPDTLAGVMSYLCGRRLLDSIGLCDVHGGEVLSCNGQMYIYGRFEGTNGVPRWMIDTGRS